jgi:hypothetical protein
MSEEETDDEHGLGDTVNDTDLEGKDEERTFAAVVAEEGRGLIVQGDSVPTIQVQIQPGVCCDIYLIFIISTQRKKKRYNPSSNWIFIDSKRDPCVSDFHVTSNIVQPSRFGYLCQLPWCIASSFIRL